MIARRWFQISALGGLVLLISVVLDAPVAAGASTTQYVDDDGHAGRVHGCDGFHAAHTTIQRAVDHAAPGSRILVCPGVYREILNVTGPAKDGLVIEAVEPWAAILRPPRGVGGSLVTIADADRVRVRWFRLRAPTRGACARIRDMVRVTDRSSDVVIRGNRLVPTGFDTIGRCGYAVGVRVRDGASALIAHNLIRDFQRNGVLVDGRGAWRRRVWAGIRYNSILFQHAAEAHGIRDATGVSIVSRTLDGGGHPPGYGPARASVYRNVIAGLASAGSGPGDTPVLGGGIGGISTGIWALGNQVRHVAYGIGLFDVGASIRDNTIEDARGDGISVDGDGNLVRISGNTVLRSGATGIDAGVVRGRVTNNTSLGSDELDCRSVGTSTWINNIGETSDPPGLCTPPA
jgi:hypothetical protein